VRHIDTSEINRHNWLYAPHHRYGFQHVQAFVPTLRVSRGGGPIRLLPRRSLEFDKLTVSPSTGDPKPAALAFHDALSLTHTDAVLVMHQGQVVMEEYFHGMRPDTLHLLMSCTKSYVGLQFALFEAIAAYFE
jgi:CubicO group peptidase (beta-lactamase class C family)